MASRWRKRSFLPTDSLILVFRWHFGRFLPTESVFSYRNLNFGKPFSGHFRSRPFSLDFSLMDKARWLHEILDAEGIARPILIGQSMGGYVAQCFMELYPGFAAGFISIDSAPLQRRYVTAADIWMLRNCEWMYRMFPWKLLVSSGASGCAQTGYGRSLMREMMLSYSHSEYCSLAGHGYRILACTASGQNGGRMPETA